MCAHSETEAGGKKAEGRSHLMLILGEIFVLKTERESTVETCETSLTQIMTAYVRFEDVFKLTFSLKLISADT